MTNKVLHNVHLHPLTLAFDAGLRQGAITTDIAEIFLDRIHQAILEHKVRSNPRGLKGLDVLEQGAYKAGLNQPETDDDD